MKTIDELLKEIEARAEKATPGPEHLLPLQDWVIAYRNGGLPTLVYDEMCKYVGANHEARCTSLIRDSILVALSESHARTDVPALIAIIKRCREQRDGWMEDTMTQTVDRNEYASYKARHTKADDAELLALAQGEGK